MAFKSRRTEDLLKGRASAPGTRSFLTWCPAKRAPLLMVDPARAIARQSLLAIDAVGDGTLLAATIMPDHIHLLLELGARLTVSQVVAKAKAAITRTSGRMTWQLNFFEHRLREPDPAEPYAFYIFMNPYCANLCPLDRSWPGWLSPRHVRWEFEDKMKDGGLPQPEWLAEARQFSNTLPDGAD